jgi:hypothetical protein
MNTHGSHMAYASGVVVHLQRFAAKLAHFLMRVATFEGSIVNTCEDLPKTFESFGGTFNGTH